MKKKLFFLLILSLLITHLHAGDKKSKAKRYRYDLAICAIFQQEGPYLKEWIEYHRLLGVQHFYLFNNLSTDNFLSVLNPYISEGIVDLYDWSYTSTGLLDYNNIQVKAYNTQIALIRNEVKWLALIDIDEFIQPLQTDNLLKFLKNYEDYGALVVNWQCFGTSGVKKIPEDKLMIECLIWKAFPHFERNLVIKSIIRPERVVGCEDAHAMKFVEGYYQVNSNFEKCRGMYAPKVVVDKIQINHYWTRDEHFFYNVKWPRLKKWTQYDYDWNNTNLFFSQVEDFSIQRFVPRLRARM